MLLTWPFCMQQDCCPWRSPAMQNRINYWNGSSPLHTSTMIEISHKQLQRATTWIKSLVIVRAHHSRSPKFRVPHAHDGIVSIKNQQTFSEQAGKTAYYTSTCRKSFSMHYHSTRAGSKSIRIRVCNARELCRWQSTADRLASSASFQQHKPRIHALLTLSGFGTSPSLRCRRTSPPPADRVLEWPNSWELSTVLIRYCDN